VACQLGSSRHHLSDRNSLAFSVEEQSGSVGRKDWGRKRRPSSPSRHSTNDVVADLGVEGVAQTEEGDEDVASLGDGLLAGADTSAGGRSTSSSGESQGLADGQVREMVVVL